MKFGFCHISSIDVYSEDTFSSEQKCQLLFGEYYIIDENKKGFTKIVTQNGTIGYIVNSVIFYITKKQYAELERKEKFLTTDILSTIEFNNKLVYLSIGSSLYDFDGLSCQFLGNSYNYSANAISICQSKENRLIELLVKKTLNFPFKNGGNTLMGMDGLGLAIHFFKYLNITIERNLESLSTKGISISLVKECQFGDIIFFGEKKIDHIGIVLNSKTLIHSFGSVKISTYDYLGIKEDNSEKYSHSRIQKIIRLF